ncbi:MAG TPA: hypothetical protein VMG09_13615 [Bacteroidota bacterium]|nr:hypothetical protein [Bacteroidota bacterium]
MSVPRGNHKVERVTITLFPTAEEHSYENVPTTFSTINRSYEWRRSSHMRYMIVPKRISSREVLIDFFVEHQGKLPAAIKNTLNLVESFVQHKIASEWKGLKLGGLSRPTNAVPPNRTFVRGTIEEMLGTKLVR